MPKQEVVKKPGKAGKGSKPGAAKDEAKSFLSLVEHKGGRTAPVSFAELLIDDEHGNPRGKQEDWKDGLTELRQAYKAQGSVLRFPVLVQELATPKDGKRYRLVDGFRRCAVVQDSGAKEVPAYIVPHNLNAMDILVLQLSANNAEVRHDIDDARLVEQLSKAITRLKEAGHMDVEETLRKAGGYSRSRWASLMACRSAQQGGEAPRVVGILMREHGLSAGVALEALSEGDEWLPETQIAQVVKELPKRGKIGLPDFVAARNKVAAKAADAAEKGAGKGESQNPDEGAEAQQVASRADGWLPDRPKAATRDRAEFMFANQAIDLAEERSESEFNPFNAKGELQGGPALWMLVGMKIASGEIPFPMPVDGDPTATGDGALTPKARALIFRRQCNAEFLTRLLERHADGVSKDGYDIIEKAILEGHPKLPGKSKIALAGRDASLSALSQIVEEMVESYKVEEVPEGEEPEDTGDEMDDE